MYKVELYQFRTLTITTNQPTTFTMQRTIKKLNQELSKRPGNESIQKQLKLIDCEEVIVFGRPGEIDILREEDLREQIREKYRKRHLKDVIESVKDDLTTDDNFICNLSEEIMVQIEDEVKHKVQSQILQETEKLRVHMTFDEISQPLIKEMKQNLLAELKDELITEMKQEFSSMISTEISKQILPIRNQVNRVLSLRNLSTQETSTPSFRSKRKLDFEN